MQISIVVFALVSCGLFHGWPVQASAPMQSCQFAESDQVSCKEKTDVQGSEETSLLQVRGGNKQADDTRELDQGASLKEVPREGSSTGSQDCCGSSSGSFAGISFGGKCADGTPGTPFCGVGTCNAVGCGCEGGCRKPAGWNLPAPIKPPVGVKPFPEVHQSDIEYAWKLATLCQQVYHLYGSSAEQEKAEMAVRDIDYMVWWRKPPSTDLVNTMKVIYVNDAAKRAVLTIRGSVSVNDWLTDAFSIGTFHVHPEQEVEEIKSLKLLIESRKPGYSILITGHSLGGYLTEVGATTFNLPGIAFAAPSPGSSHNGQARPENFQIINNWYDKLGNMDGWVFKEQHFKHPMFLKDMEGHGIDEMVQLLHQQAPELTNYEPWVQHVLHGQYQSYFTPYNDNPTSPNNWKKNVVG